jgi:hypothetical protein
MNYTHLVVNKKLEKINLISFPQMRWKNNYYLKFNLLKKSIIYNLLEYD